MTVHKDQQDELAKGLRRLMEVSGTSTRELGRRLGWSQSKVSRVARGETLPKPAEVEAWARTLNAPADERRRLVDLAEQAAIQLTDWRREVAPGRVKLQNEIGELEASASVIRVFGMDVVPWPAQTPEYMEAMFRLGQHESQDRDTLADLVSAREARHATVRDPSKRFKLLCTETALMRNLLDREGMETVVGRIEQVAALSNVDFGVIPFAHREVEHTYLAFAVIGDPECDASAIVLAELPTRGVTIRAADEVAEWIRHFDRLFTAAKTGNDLPSFLQEVSQKAPWS
jgi:transcriptional regulator with XRE-family HTH domain